MRLITAMNGFLRPVGHTWRILNANKVIGNAAKVTLSLTVLSIAILLFTLKDLPPLVPLWYSKPWGEDRLVSPLFLFILPMGSLVWYAVSAAFMVRLSADFLVFSQMLATGSLIVSAMSFLTLVKILTIIL